MAVARGSMVAVFQVATSLAVPINAAQKASQAAPRYMLLRASSASDAITDMAWVTFQQRQKEDAATSLGGASQAQGGGPASCLLVGTASGHIQIHSASGRLLLRQRLHTGPVQSIRVRHASMGEKRATNNWGDENERPR